MALWLLASSRKMMLFWNLICSKQGFVLLTTSVLASVSFQNDAQIGKKILFYSVNPPPQHARCRQIHQRFHSCAGITDVQQSPLDVEQLQTWTDSQLLPTSLLPCIPILTFPSGDAKGLWNVPHLIPQISQTFALPVATVPVLHICILIPFLQH